MKAYYSFVPKDRETQTKNAVIPIGILNVEGQLLTLQQIEENKTKKANGQKANGQAYEKVRLIAASPLQPDVFNGRVEFEVNERYQFSSKGEKIEEIALDFRDGKGFQPVAPGQRVVHQYTSPGRKTLNIRLKINGVEYLSFSDVTVKTLEPYPTSLDFEVTAERVKVDEGVKNGRISSVTGAAVRVINGCDGVFDKPVVIVEGFDYGNERSLDMLINDYLGNFSNGSFSGVFNRMLTYGYDLTFVNFSDARDYLQNNANVLKAVISEVNRQKSGYAQSVVVGESAGGIIARSALRQLEQHGVDHKVSHYISFDSPHQGANVPIGIQLLAKSIWDVDAVRAASWIDDLFPPVNGSGLGDLNGLLKNGQTPAARQLLINNASTLGPNPDFLSLQQELQQMGHPNNCTRLCVVSGSVTNTPQRSRTNGDQNQGQQIFGRSDFYWLYEYTAKAYTHVSGQNSPASRFSMRIGLIPTISDWNVTFALNRDLTPGGVSTQVADADYYNIGFWFSFVPTYSAIDFQGAINSDADMVLANAVSAPSPFSRIYGNNANDIHVSVPGEAVAWETLFSEQFGMNGNSPGCPAPVSNYPPVPYFQAPDQMCGYDQASFEADGTFSGINLTYSWVIRIMTGPNADQVVSTGSGPTYNLAANNYPPGMYEVTCTCWYPNHPGATSSYAYTISINQNCGGGGRLAAEPGLEPDVLMAPYPNPSTGLVRIDLALEPGETGQLFLRSSSGNSLAERSVVGNGQVERYNFDLGNAPGTLYLLELNTNRRRLTRKVLMTR